MVGDETLEETDWYRLDVAEAFRQLKSDPQDGLDDVEAARRLEQYGPNELAESGGRGPGRILWEQFSGAMVIMLIVAALVSWYLGEYKDAIAILTIVILNAILGFVQDYRAERAMAALKQLAVPTVNLRRGGKLQQRSARDLVPGDLVLLEAGSLVPADCRVQTAVNLRAQESALTGESEPVEKQSDALPDTRTVADRTNMLYMGTIITYGRGQGVVTATGMQSELGRIAELLRTVQREPTPLQRRLAQLGRGLAVVALAIVAVVFALGLLRGGFSAENVKLMFMTALSLAVAAVPEGLPAVATVALAVGANRMLRRKALIRKLPAVETLGSVTVICSDKTGTLTENRMSVQVLDFAGDRLSFTEEMSRGVPVLEPDDDVRKRISDRPGLTLLAAGGGLCNDAVLEPESHRPGFFHAVGDPTEGALVIAAARVGLIKAELEQTFPRVAELPFDSVRKRMTTIHQLVETDGRVPDVLETAVQAIPGLTDDKLIAFTKGAVDSVLDVSAEVWVKDHAEPLDASWRQRIVEAQDRMADSGMRVLGVAFRRIPGSAEEVDAGDAERDLVFLGMSGMIDPPRPEVKEAVMRCKTAGIRPIMITGDHPLTALHIARDLGITADGETLTGHDLASMSLAELEQKVDAVSVYARVSPEHKLNIVEALQDKGQIVAMTGDGVNDAPALKKADIGVAMGITGTDVSKEAADTVLLDDNFATVVNAVEEGRIIFDNIRKFIKYTMTSNAGEIWVMLLAPFLGMPLPLLPLQILWVNLVTDGLPGLALAVEPAERDTMRRPPYPPRQSIIDRAMAIDIIWIGLLMGIISLGAGYWYWSIDRTSVYDASWGTKIFTVLTLSQMGNVLALRSSRDSLFTIGLWSNRFMMMSVLLTFGLQMAVVYAPPLNKIFRTTPLSARELAVCLVLSTLVFGCVELGKWLRRRGATLPSDPGMSEH